MNSKLFDQDRIVINYTCPEGPLFLHEAEDPGHVAETSPSDPKRTSR
jgi:hypothetical protein